MKRAKSSGHHRRFTHAVLAPLLVVLLAPFAQADTSVDVARCEASTCASLSAIERGSCVRTNNEPLDGAGFAQAKLRADGIDGAQVAASHDRRAGVLFVDAGPLWFEATAP